MSIFSSIGAGIGSIWSSIATWTAAAFAAVKTTVATVVAKAAGVPIVGPVVSAASAIVTKTTAVVTGAAKGLVSVLNANPVVTTIALSLPHTWRAMGWVVDKAADVTGWVAGKVAAGATWVRNVVSDLLDKIPGVGGTVSGVFDSVTGFIGRGVGGVAGFVSSSVRNVAGSWRHRTTSRAAAITFLAASGIQFGLGLLGVGLGFFGTPAFAALLAVGVALTAYPAAVWFDHVVASREAEMVDVPADERHAAAVDDVLTDIASGHVPTDKVDGVEVGVAAEAETEAETKAEAEPVSDEDIIASELVECSLPLKPADQGKRKLMVLENAEVFDPADIKWHRRIAYLGSTEGVPVGVDMAPREGQRKLSDEEHGKRLRMFAKAVDEYYARTRAAA